MAAEAEAGRAARAKVIAADGEMRSSRALAEASDIIEKSPAAIQLRYLQVRQPPTMHDLNSLDFVLHFFFVLYCTFQAVSNIARDKKSLVAFLMPIGIVPEFSKKEC